ncbi:MAG: thioredoxin family protein [Myxococcaceae bacterium]
MATVKLTNDGFMAAVEKPGILFIDWWATWCAPCRAFAPTYEKVSEKHPDIVFAKVDVDAEQALAGEFQIRSIPTLMVFRDGLPLLAQPGMLPEAALEEVIKQVRALDMDEVRKQIAEHAKKAGAPQPGAGPGSQG